MKILYYYWNENSKEDCVEAMTGLGHNVTVWDKPVKSLSSDPEFTECTAKELKAGAYDLIFSFNYFPPVSEAAQSAGVPYISWVYDSPHYTLESLTLSNACNHVFIFDYAMCELYRMRGIDTVDYLPLPVNTVRLDKLLTAKREKSSFEHDITFIGSLYNDGHNYYDQIGFLPDYLKGYLDAVIKAQELIFGLDMPSQMLDAGILEEIKKYVKADLGAGFNDARDEIIRNMLRKKVTVNERKNLLKALGENFSVDLYSGTKPDSDMHVKYMGIAENRVQMPEIFASSRINLNISLRSILTGIPLRVIEILGAGGFCLTNYQAELGEYFENGRELVWFESAEDMLDKAGYFLEHEDERKKIALCGLEAARERFSYDVLLPKLLGCI